MAAAAMSRRIFFYVQHLLGIGHLVRANRIAEALVAAGCEVTVAMGGMPVAGFPGAGIGVAPLPPVRAGKAGFTALEDAEGRPVDEAFWAERRRRLLAALAQCRPDAVIVETFPFGRRVLRFELVAMLEAARAMPRRPLVACSVRDILQERPKPGRAEETVAMVEKYFDIVLVHGDPRFAALAETFPPAHTLSRPVVHTGLVAGPPPPEPRERYDIVVSAGGGAAGLALVEAASQLPRRLSGVSRICLITGPNLPQAAAEALAKEAAKGLEVFPFRADFPSLLRGAGLSISQAGYNTVCDILRAGCRSLLVPFARDGETEQTARARRMQQLGLAALLAEEELDGERLAAQARLMLAKPPPPPHGLDLDGARRSAELLRDRLDG
jgi:predicted glycosyltransferase